MIYALAEIITLYGNRGVVETRTEIPAALEAAHKETGTWACAVAAGPADERMEILAWIDGGGEIRWKDRQYRTIESEYPGFDLGGIEVPADFTDTSWHNDISPSFELDGHVRLWVDFLDPEEREMGPEWPRFRVEHLSRGEDPGLIVGDPIYLGEDFELAVKKARAAVMLNRAEELLRGAADLLDSVDPREGEMRDLARQVWQLNGAVGE
jgi:hypothetical protein